MKALGANPNVDWVDCNMAVHTALLGTFSTLPLSPFLSPPPLHSSNAC